MMICLATSHCFDGRLSGASSDPSLSCGGGSSAGGSGGSGGGGDKVGDLYFEDGAGGVASMNAVVEGDPHVVDPFPSDKP